MRTAIASVLALAAILCGSRLGPVPVGADPAPPAAEPKKPAETVTLEDVLTAALRSNPDLRVAEAKVHEAEAELQRVRVQVIQKMVKLQSDLQSQREQLKTAEENYRRSQELFSKGFAAGGDLQASRAALEKAKSDLAGSEAQVPYILGPSARKAAPGDGKPQTLCPALQTQNALAEGNCLSCHTVQPGLAKLTAAHWIHSPSSPARLPKTRASEAIRKVLDGPMPLREQAEKPLKAVVQELQRASGDAFPYLLQAGDKEAAPVAVLKGTPSLGAYLLAVEDMLPDVRFVVREYGLLVTTRDRLPDGAVTLRAFLQQGD
jgi:hypothetical protein